MININRIENFFNKNKSIGIFFLRIFIAFRLLYGVVDNIIKWERMMEFSNFLNSHNFPLPLVSALTSVYLQFFCSLLILIGFKVRLASFILVINFSIALIFIHISTNDTIEDMTPALAMLFGCLTLLFIGAEKITLKNILRKMHHYFLVK